MYTKSLIIAAATILPMATAFSPSMSLSTRQAASARLTGVCALRSADETVASSGLAQGRRSVVAAGLAFLGGAVLPKYANAAAPAAEAPAAAAPAAVPAPAPAAETPKAPERKPGDKKFNGDYVVGTRPLPGPSSPNGPVTREPCALKFVYTRTAASSTFDPAHGRSHATRHLTRNPHSQPPCCFLQTSRPSCLR